MKTIQYLSVLILCTLLMTSCASKIFHIESITQHTYKNIQFTVWYNEDAMTLPLLASLEWKSFHDVNPQLGLIMLQGKRFAHCTLDENIIQCILDDAMPSIPMQKIANYTAQCIMHSCLLYEENTKNGHQKDMQGWKCSSQSEINYTFTQTSPAITIQVKIEEVITWP